MTAMAAEPRRVIDLVGPKGYIHGWIKVGEGSGELDSAVRKANVTRAKAGVLKRGQRQRGDIGGGFAVAGGSGDIERPVADALIRAARTGKTHYVIPTAVGMQASDTKAATHGGYLQVKPDGEVTDWRRPEGKWAPHQKTATMSDHAVRAILEAHLSKTQTYQAPAPQPKRPKKDPDVQPRSVVARLVKDIQKTPALQKPEYYQRAKEIAAKSGVPDLIPSEWAVGRDQMSRVVDLAVKAGQQQEKTARAKAAGPARPAPASRTVRPSKGVQDRPDPSAPVQPPASRRGLTPLTPMRRQAAKSMRKLAQQVQQSHPDMAVHDHVRDAARMLESGNEEAAQRHLRAAAFALTPQSLHRQGVHDDGGHIAARQAVHGLHRHMLLVRDITDAGEKNLRAIGRASYGDATSSPPAPSYGGDSGALAQKPVARQPGGDRALNAPARTNSGGSDVNAADPDGPQPKGSKQFSYGWGDLAAVIGVIELTGDAQHHHIPGSPDEWRHGYVPLTEGAARSHFHGKVPKGWSAPGGGGKGKAAAKTAPAKAVAKPARPASPEHAAVASAIGKMRQAIKDRVAKDEDLPSWERDRAAGPEAPVVHAALDAVERESAGDAGVQRLGKAMQSVEDALAPSMSSRGRLGMDPSVKAARDELVKAVIGRQEGIAVKGLSPNARHVAFEDPLSGLKSYNDLRDPESLRSYAQQGALRGLKMTEASGPPDLSGVPKSGQQFYKHAVAHGWNVSLHVDRDRNGKPIYRVVAANPEKKLTSSQSFAQGKRTTYAAEPVSASLDRITRNPRDQYAEKGGAGAQSARTAADARSLAADMRRQARTGTPQHAAAKALAGAVKDITAGRSPVSTTQSARDVLAQQLKGLQAERDQMLRDRAKGKYVMLGDVSQQIERTQGLLDRADALLTAVKAGGGAQLAYSWDDLASAAAAVIDLSAETAALERTPAPIGKPGGPGLYDVKGNKHADYFENVRNALMRKRGIGKAQAHAMTWGILRRWAKGGGDVHPEVRAAAVKALAEEDAARAKAHAHTATWDQVLRQIDLAAAPRGWDGVALELATVIDLYNPSQPRVPAGQAGGGQFAPGAATAAPTSAKPVGLGAAGQQVTDLQKRLNALGAKPPLQVDGKFGARTLTAVKAYQKAHGLKVDGLVGPKTTAALRLKTQAAKKAAAA